MQVLQRRVVAVAVKGLLGSPLDKNQDRARLDTSGRDLTKLAKGNDSAAVSLDLAGRSARICQVLVLVGDIEEIERIDGSGHGHLAESDSEELEPALTMSALGQILRQPATAGCGRPRPVAAPAALRQDGGAGDELLGVEGLLSWPRTISSRLTDEH
jgi:hypothetical protein